MIKEAIKLFVLEVFEEAKVKISPAYKRKEAIRAELQRFVLSKVKSGEIKDQNDLDHHLSSMNLALIALKMIPFDVWKRM